MSKKRWDIDTIQEQEALLWLKVEKGGWVKGTRCDNFSICAYSGCPTVKGRLLDTGATHHMCLALTAAAAAFPALQTHPSVSQLLSHQLASSHCSSEKFTGVHFCTVPSTAPLPSHLFP